MRPRFCPRCGKKDIQGDLCAHCAHREHPLDALPTRVEFCVHCRRYKRRNTWILFKGFREVIREAVEKSLEKTQKQSACKVLIPEHELRRLKELHKTPKPGLQTEIPVGIQQPDNPLPQITQLTIFFTTCTNCGKRGTQYFEGILQIRKAPEEVYAFIRKKLDLEKG